jgi:hypothetical protein
MVSKCCSAIESAERIQNVIGDSGEKSGSQPDNGTLRHQFFRVIDHLPGEILDREFLTSVVRVLITEQLHRIVPPSRSDDLVALARLIRYDHGVTPSDRRCGPPRRSVTMIALPKTNTISAIVPR